MPLDISAALTSTFDFRYFHPDHAINGQIAIPHIWVPGTSKIVLVLGDNAGGKSFFRRLVRLVTHAGGQAKVGPHPVEEFIHLSMESRTSTGMGMDRISRVLVYGDESEDSTGQLTATIVEGGIKTAEKRDNSIILYWDEPDIGMAAAAQAGVGVRIREFASNLPEHVEAVFITTHSPILVAQLLKAEESPHYIFLGGDGNPPQTVQEWVKEQFNPDIEPRMPNQVVAAGKARYHLIQGILDDKKREAKK